MRLKIEDGVITAPVVFLGLHDKTRLEGKPELISRQCWYPSNCNTQAALTVRQQWYLGLLMDTLMLIAHAMPAQGEIKGIWPLPQDNLLSPWRQAPGLTRSKSFFFFFFALDVMASFNITDHSSSYKKLTAQNGQGLSHDLLLALLGLVPSACNSSHLPVKCGYQVYH